MAEKTGLPNYKNQKLEIYPLLSQKLKLGDEWYLVDQRWLKQWKKCSSFDTWDQIDVGNEAENPGPVDNCNLFKDYEGDALKDNLKEELDYCLLPKAAWEKFILWYGLTSGSKPICRYVVEYGKRLEVEIYLLNLKLCLHPFTNEIQCHLFSIADTIKVVTKRAREVLKVPGDADVRLWKWSYGILKNPEHTLADAGVFGAQLLMMEIKSEEGEWSTKLHSTSTSLDRVKISVLRRQFKMSQQQIDTAERSLVETQQKLSIMSTRVEEQQQAIEDAYMTKQEMEQAFQDTIVKQQELEQAIQETNMKKQEMEETIEEANRRAEMIQQINDTTQQQLQELTRVLQQHIQDSTQRISELEEQLKQENTSVQSHDKIHWVIERDEVQITQEILGRGGWGEVKVGVFRGTRVAVKCLYEVILSEYNLTLFSREMDIASRVRHPNLLQFIGATKIGNPLIITELMPTSLRKELEKSTLTRPQIIGISNDVASALNYLHLWKPQPILHRDVSSANVLLEASSSGRWKGKLSDYGSANLLHQIRTAAPGSPSYAAPEAISPPRHSPAMDIYSFGVLFMQMVYHLQISMKEKRKLKVFNALHLRF